MTFFSWNLIYFREKRYQLNLLESKFKFSVDKKSLYDKSNETYFGCWNCILWQDAHLEIEFSD